MIKKMWRWVTLADLPDTHTGHVDYKGVHTTWFTITAHNSRTEYSACCADHLYAGLKVMGYEGLAK